MAMPTGKSTTGGLEPGEDYQDLQRRIDEGASAKTSREGEKLASKLSISLEELDRRLHQEDARRDAAGLPPLANAAIREGAGLDDFGSEPGANAAAKRDSGFVLEGGSGGPSNTVDQDQEQRSGGSATAQSAREARQHEAREALHKRFHQTGDSYYYKDDSARLAFVDRGSRLITQEKDARTASAMAVMAEAKGWSTIKVSGDESFRREVWLEASLRGIHVKGYQPKEADLAALDIKRDQRSRNGVEPVSTKERAHEEPTREAVKRFAKTKQQAEDCNLVRPEAQTRSGKSLVVEAVASAVVVEKIKSPAVRQQVMKEVTRQLDRQKAKGKEPPTVHAYDKDAPANARDTGHARPPIDRKAERTR